MTLFLNQLARAITRKSILEYIRIPTLQNIVLIFFSSIAASGLGFSTSILLSRNLGPSNFGIYSMSILFVGMTTQLADLGINSGIVRFVSQFLTNQNITKAGQVLFISLIWKVVSAVLSCIILYLSAGILATYVFHKPVLYQPLQLASFGIIGALMLGFFSAVLQSHNLFRRKAFLDIFVGIAELALILLLVASHYLTVQLAIIVFCLGPLLGMLLGMILAPQTYFRFYEWDRELARKIFQFNKWITLSTLCSIFLTRIELLILGNTANTYSTGLFAAASQLATVMPILAGSITSVLFPKVAAFQTNSQMRRYVRLSVSLSLFLIVCFTPVIVFAPQIIQVIYGIEYIPAVPFFQILFVSYFFTLLKNPLSLLLYSLDKPYFLTWVSASELIVSIVFNVILIKGYGAMGAGYTALLVRTAASLMIAASLWYLLNKNQIADVA